MQPASTLSAPVGPGQLNKPEDIALVRRLLNNFINLGLLPGLPAFSETGVWDETMAKALKAIEEKYFFGTADPNNKLENDDTLFNFLSNADLSQKQIAATLSAEAYQLAALMVPGGADWTKRTVIKTTETVNGKPKIKRQIKSELVPGSIRTYLPLILQALRDTQLNDTDMLMMALATVRAEASGFKPIDEGISRYNTSPTGTKGRHAFDLYDLRDDIGNEQDGDGALYKGRGFVQLTGKSNYISIGAKVGVNLLNNPDLANDPMIAAKVLAHFLKTHEVGIRAALRDNNLALARRKVNGGSHGLREFVNAFEVGRKFLGIVVPQKARIATKVKPRKK
jgi:predicted chitinase